MKNLLKKLYYKIYNNDALSDYTLNFLYIFHTEYIFNDALYKQHLSFCNSYKKLTGSKVINSIMTGINPRINKGIVDNGLEMSEFIERVKTLSEISTIAYHGHYHVDLNNHEAPEGEIHCNNFLYSAIKEQMKNDLKWFKDFDIDHNNIYAPGWYFMNKKLIALLINNGFETDYSYSRSKWFSNDYTQSFFNKNKIEPGMPFKVILNNKSIDCIQALIGCHNTPFVEDFERNLLKVFSNKNNNIFGCFSAHEDDLDVKNTLNCIEKMMTKWNAKFLSHDDIKPYFNNTEIGLFEP